MQVALIIFALLFAIVVHEGAHVLAMRADGIRIIGAGLGLPFKPTLTLRARGIAWTLSPWLVGAYVEPEPYEELDHSYRRLAWHWGAGVTANLVLAALAGAVALAATKPMTAVGLLLLGALTWFFRIQVAAFVQPLLAFPMLLVLAYGLGHAWAEGETGVGLAGLGALAPQEVTLQSAAGVLAIISFALGVANLVPLYPCDNARTVNYLIERRWGWQASERFRVGGVLVLGALMVAAIISDVWAAVSSAFS